MKASACSLRVWVKHVVLNTCPNQMEGFFLHSDAIDQELDSLFLSTIHPDLWILLSIVVEVVEVTRRNFHIVVDL